MHQPEIFRIELPAFIVRHNPQGSNRFPFPVKRHQQAFLDAPPHWLVVWIAPLNTHFQTKQITSERRSTYGRLYRRKNFRRIPFSTRSPSVPNGWSVVR